MLYLGCCELFSLAFKYNGVWHFLNIDDSAGMLPVLLKILHLKFTQKTIKGSLICLQNLLSQQSIQLYLTLTTHDGSFL
jgi:hypothetical protein